MGSVSDGRRSRLLSGLQQLSVLSLPVVATVRLSSAWAVVEVRHSQPHSQQPTHVTCHPRFSALLTHR